MEIDKIQQAEWKLAGLCVLCGADKNKPLEFEYDDEFVPTKCLFGFTERWELTADLCYGKIEAFNDTPEQTVLYDECYPN